MATTCDPFLPTLSDLPALPELDAVDNRPPRLRSWWTGLRLWLRTKGAWWRYRYVPGAPYPPRLDLTSYRVPCTWLADLRAGLRNPPEVERKLRRRR